MTATRRLAQAGYDHTVTVYLQPYGSHPYVFVCIGMRQGPGGSPFRAARHDFTYSNLDSWRTWARP